MAEGGSDERPTSAPSGGPDVFISYASQDTGVAHDIVATLERSGLRCWIAPRDVTPGAHYADSIILAIIGAKAFVLVLSDSALVSKHVGKEIERASSKGRPIIALRTGIAPLPPAFEYFLSESQWIDGGAGGVAPVATKLVEAVRSHLGPAIAGEARTHSAPPVVSRGVSAPRKRWMLPGLIAGALLTCGLVYLVADGAWRSKGAAGVGPVSGMVKAALPTSASISERSIAVLPFVDMSENKDQEYFADGMAEELLDVLVRIPPLKVIGRTSSFQFKGRNEDLRVIGSKLGVAYVVEGSVRKAGKRIRVTAQLIDTRSGAHLWADSYDRDFGDVLALQDQIATNIARALQLAVGADDTPTSQTLRSTDAYTLYLRGRSAYDSGTAGTREAQSYFEQALALDPSLLRAAEALAVAYAADVEDSYVPSDIGWRHVREAADKALQIDATSPIAHTLLGHMHGYYEYDWAAAEVELTKARASHSRNPLALAWAAGVASALGHRDQAMRLNDASLSTDPLSPDGWSGRADLLSKIGDIEGAEIAYRKCLEISPTWTEIHLYIGQMLLLRGRFEAALAETQLATPYDGRDINLAMIYHALGRKSASDVALARLMREYGDLWPQNIAQVYAYRGEAAQAFEWFEKAYAARKVGLLPLLRDDPTTVRLRTDPRRNALLRKMNLPE
jgi:TolB-like protein